MNRLAVPGIAECLLGAGHHARGAFDPPSPCVLCRGFLSSSCTPRRKVSLRFDRWEKVKAEDLFKVTQQDRCQSLDSIPKILTVPSTQARRNLAGLPLANRHKDASS